MVTNQQQVAGLVYVANIDNSAGGATNYPLVVIDAGSNPPDTVTATMGDGSQTDLSRWLADRAKVIFAADNSNAAGAFAALISLQSTNSGLATPATSVAVVGTTYTLRATIPGGYVGSFIWGMQPSIEGGFLLPANVSGGGGGGGVSSVNSGTGITVDNTDPANPIVNLDTPVDAANGGTGLSGSGVDATKYLKSDGAGGWTLATPGGGGGGVASVTAVAPLVVDATDPANPEVGIDQMEWVVVAGDLTHRDQVGWMPNLTAAIGDQDMVVMPRGTTGALVMLPRQPGNPIWDFDQRGSHAVDMQGLGTANSQVASGNYAATVGGRANTASAESSGNFAGFGNIVNSFFGVNVGGFENTVGPGFGAATIGGTKNLAAGGASTVVGSAATDWATGGRHVIGFSTQYAGLPRGNAQVSRLAMSLGQYAVGVNAPMSSTGIGPQTDPAFGINVIKLPYKAAAVGVEGYRSAHFINADITVIDSAGNAVALNFTAMAYINLAGVTQFVSNPATVVAASPGAPAYTVTGLLAVAPTAPETNDYYTIAVDGSASGNDQQWVAHVEITEAMYVIPALP